MENLRNKKVLTKMCSPLADFIFSRPEIQNEKHLLSPLLEKVQYHFQHAFLKHLLHSYTGPAPALVSQ